MTAASEAGALPVAPIDRRTVIIALLAILLASAAGLAAQLPTRLIGLVTNIAFHGRVATSFEATRQPLGLLPLLAWCTAAYIVSLPLS